jgi:hypothetical protein
MPEATENRTAPSIILDLLERVHEMLGRFVDRQKRQTLLEQANRDFAALRADDEAWREELAERRLWDGTLADGLEADDRPDAVTR